MKKGEMNEIIFAIFFGVATLFPAMFLYKNILLATSLVLIVSGLGILFWRTKSNLYIFVFAGIFGPISEMLCVHHGAWNYSIANFVNIPVWLFFIWGNAGQFLYNTGLLIKRLIKE